MKYAIINPVDNSVHEIQDVMAPSDITMTIGAPYIVQAADDTAVGDIYDPGTAAFKTPEPDPPAAKSSTSAKSSSTPTTQAATTTANPSSTSR